MSFMNFGQNLLADMPASKMLMMILLIVLAVS